MHAVAVDLDRRTDGKRRDKKTPRLISNQDIKQGLDNANSRTRRRFDQRRNGISQDAGNDDAKMPMRCDRIDGYESARGEKDDGETRRRMERRNFGETSELAKGPMAPLLENWSESVT